MVTRRMARKDYEVPIRTSMLEDDADRFEQFMTDLANKTSAEVAAVRRLLTGILVSVTTACILLTVNIVVLGSNS